MATTAAVVDPVSTLGRPGAPRRLVVAVAAVRGVWGHRKLLGTGEPVEVAAVGVVGPVSAAQKAVAVAVVPHFGYVLCAPVKMAAAEVAMSALN